MIQIWPHDWQCCANRHWDLAWERCSRTAREMPSIGHVWQVNVPIMIRDFPKVSKISFLFACLSFSIATLAVAQNMRELYRLVLVDTPLAPYFSECITSEVLIGELSVWLTSLSFCMNLKWANLFMLRIVFLVSVTLCGMQK